MKLLALTSQFMASGLHFRQEDKLAKANFSCFCYLSPVGSAFQMARACTGTMWIKFAVIAYK